MKSECLLLMVRLKPLDVEVMQQLHNKVNIIPLIAKADTMTADECRDFKKTVSFSLGTSYLLWNNAWLVRTCFV